MISNSCSIGSCKKKSKKKCSLEFCIADTLFTYKKCHHGLFSSSVFCIFYRTILKLSVWCVLQAVVDVAPLHHSRLLAPYIMYILFIICIPKKDWKCFLRNILSFSVKTLSNSTSIALRSQSSESLHSVTPDCSPTYLDDVLSTMFSAFISNQTIYKVRYFMGKCARGHYLSTKWISSEFRLIVCYFSQKYLVKRGNEMKTKNLRVSCLCIIFPHMNIILEKWSIRHL